MDGTCNYTVLAIWGNLWLSYGREAADQLMPGLGDKQRNEPLCFCDQVYVS